MSKTPWKHTIDVDDALSTPARIAILLFLLPRSTSTFSSIQSALGITAGNLSSHLKKLDEMDYILIEKKFIDGKPTTLATITSMGHANIVKYINILNSVIDPPE